MRRHPRALAAGALALFTSSASADEIADFYRGRQLQIVIGYEVGGGYDAYGRLLARFLPKHLPGNPTAISQNMVGAGSRVASNWLYNVAPKDGTVLGVTSQSTPLDQAMQQRGIQFDAAKFNWIGNPIVDNQITIAWAPSGIATMADLTRRNDIVCGGTGASTNPGIFPRIINQLTGSSIRVVTGYQGAAAIILAMERGEVSCMGSHSWSTAKATMAHHLREGKIATLVQWGPVKDPEISQSAGRDVPLIADYARNDMDRAVLALFDSSMSIGRPLLAPPDVPRARVDAQRRAFDATMKDPEVLAEARRLNLDIRPMAGAALQQLATDVTRAPPEIIARAQELMR